MNAASRLVHQGALTKQFVLKLLLTKEQIAVSVLLFFALIFSITIIYFAHQNRILHSQYQNEIQNFAHLQMQKSQLLLEKSAAMIQARIENRAKQELNMIIPDQHSAAMIQE